MRRAFTALGSSLLLGLTVTPMTMAAPVPGAIAQAEHLVAGPHTTSTGATVWVEASDKRWRLRSVAAGKGRAVTIAGQTFGGYEDYDSGEFSQESLGLVKFDGDRVLIDERHQAGSRKYFQYVHASTVSAYELTGSTAGASYRLATCSAPEDAFGGPQPSAPGRPWPSLGAGDGTIAVTLCGQTTYYGADLAKPLATVAESTGPAAIGGELALRPSTTDGARYAVSGWRDGALRYEIPAASVPGTIGGVALAADGTAAVISHPTADITRCDGTLTVHTPATPAGSVRATGVCPTPLTLTGGALAVATAPTQGGERQLTAVRADGATTALAWLWPSTATSDTPAFTLAGGQATVAVPGCDERWTIARTTGSLAPYAYRCPELALRKASRRGRTLSVRIRLASEATGPVSLSYRVGGRRLRATLTPSAGVATAKLRLPRWALGRTGTTTVTFPGDAQFVRQVDQR